MYYMKTNIQKLYMSQIIVYDKIIGSSLYNFYILIFIYKYKLYMFFSPGNHYKLSI